jgi:hypothetical protein
VTAARFANLREGSRLYRIYLTGHKPLWFGPGAGNPSRHRFDAPDGSYGVCYLARSPAGAFVEVFLRDPEAAATGTRIIAASELGKRQIVEVHLTAPLRVARLRGPGLSWRGITASVSSATPYQETQALSARIHGEPSRPMGIEYRCRHDDDEIALALFDRARGSLRVDPASALSCLDIAVPLHRIYPFVVDHDA